MQQALGRRPRSSAICASSSSTRSTRCLRGDRGGQTPVPHRAAQRAWRASTRAASGFPRPSATRRPWARFLPPAPGASRIIPRVRGAAARVAPQHGALLHHRPPGAGVAAPDHAGRRGRRLGRPAVDATGSPAGLPSRTVPQGPMPPDAASGEQGCPSMEISPRATAESPADSAPANADPGCAYIFEHTRGKKCLIFTNSREEAEDVCTVLRAVLRGTTASPTASSSITATSPPRIREIAEELMRDEASDLYHRRHRHARARHRHRAAGARLPDRRALHGVRLPAAHGPHGPARRPARDVVRHARGPARAARPHCPRPSPGSCCRASPSCSSTVRSAGSSRRAWTACPTACCTTRRMAIARLLRASSRPRELATRVLTLTVLPPRERRTTSACSCATCWRHDHIETHRGGRAHRGPRRRARDQQLQVLRRVPGERGVHRALRVAGARHASWHAAARPGEKIAIAGPRLDRRGGRPQAPPALLSRRSRGACPPTSASARETSTPASSSACAEPSTRARPTPTCSRNARARLAQARRVRQERRPHQRTARQPRGQHVVPASPGSAATPSSPSSACSRSSAPRSSGSRGSTPRGRTT